MKNKKKFILIFLIFFIFCDFSSGLVFAESNEKKEEIEESLNNTIQEQLNSLNFDSLENYLSNLSKEGLEIFNSHSFLEKIQMILSGDFGEKNVFQIIFSLFFDSIQKFLPFVGLIIAIAILAGVIGDFKNFSIGNLTHFVCFGAIIVILFSTTMSMVSMCGETIGQISGQMEVVFPILLTVITAMGGSVGAQVYQPAVVVLTSIVANIFKFVLMPLFIFSLVFSIVGNLSSNVKIDKLSNFLNSIFKWVIGIVFTIFMGFLAIQGITAHSIDSITYKTAKFSISTYVPILGGYLSEGLNVILSSCLLVKNAIGASGLLLLFSTIIVPLVNLIVFMFLLKFLGAILEPIADSKISNFISGISKSFTMPIACILGVSFMYTIFVGLIMCLNVG